MLLFFGHFINTPVKAVPADLIYYNYLLANEAPYLFA